VMPVEGRPAAAVVDDHDAAIDIGPAGRDHAPGLRGMHGRAGARDDVQALVEAHFAGHEGAFAPAEAGTDFTIIWVAARDVRDGDRRAGWLGLERRLDG